MGPLSGNLGPLSGNLGQLSGNLGPLSGNLGPLSGNLGRGTGTQKTAFKTKIHRKNWRRVKFGHTARKKGGGGPQNKPHCPKTTRKNKTKKNTIFQIWGLWHAEPEKWIPCCLCEFLNLAFVSAEKHFSFRPSRKISAKFAVFSCTKFQKYNAFRLVSVHGVFKNPRVCHVLGAQVLKITGFVLFSVHCPSRFSKPLHQGLFTASMFWS